MSVSSVAGPGERIGAVPVSAEGSASVRWDGLIAEHESYIEDKKDEWLVFVGDGAENRDEMLFKPYTHRWTQGYTERQYAQMHDFVDGALEDYDDPHVVILPALTASTTTAAGEYRPPLDHFEQLKRSWARGVRYELHHSMDADREKDDYPAREWEYLQVWEPTTDAGRTEGGYAHMHPVVVCDGPVEAERFRSVVRKHVEKCEWASLEAHSWEQTDIRPLGQLSNPAAYLFKYLGKSWQRDDAPAYQRRFDALLHETGYRRFQVSDGAQRWLELGSGGADEPWLFAGVGGGEDVERLREYGDAAEFRLDREMGVKTWLAGYDATPAMREDVEVSEASECDHGPWVGGECVRCGLLERDLVKFGPPD